MKIRSFFDEQNIQRRVSILFLSIGIIWMALMGGMIVEIHINLLTLLSLLSQTSYKTENAWRLGGVVGGIVLWIIIWLFFYISSSRFIPRIIGANPPSKTENAILSNLIEEVAISSGVSNYKVIPFILEINEPNAFASGKSPRDGSIVITRGMMNILNREELRAVIAHEFAHLKNGDSLFSIQALSFCWAILAISTGAYYFVLIAFSLLFLASFLIMKITMAFSENSEAEGCLFSLIGFCCAVALFVVGIYYLAIYVILFVVVLFLVSLGIKGASSSISKSREYLADACSAQWTRDPMALATALDKIKNYGKLPFKYASVAPLWIYSASFSDAKMLNRVLSFLFETHPLIESRIKKLIEMGGSFALMEDKIREILLSFRLSFWKRFKEIIFPVIATLLALFLCFFSYHYFSASQTFSKPTERINQPEALVMYKAVVIKPIINLRAGPGVDYPIIVKIKAGDVLIVYKEDNEWLFVSYGNLKGWVHSKLVKKV
jgi:heat shock protein HtpX